VWRGSKEWSSSRGKQEVQHADGLSLLLRSDKWWRCSGVVAVEGQRESECGLLSPGSEICGGSHNILSPTARSTAASMAPSRSLGFLSIFALLFFAEGHRRHTTTKVLFASSYLPCGV
jgi:hypothetical protein